MLYYHDIGEEKARLKSLMQRRAEPDVLRAKLASFHRSLMSATRFFSELVRRAWLMYGIGKLNIGTSERMGAVGATMDALVAIHRMIVSLGDLARCVSVCRCVCVSVCVWGGDCG